MLYCVITPYRDGDPIVIIHRLIPLVGFVLIAFYLVHLLAVMSKLKWVRTRLCQLQINP